MAMFRMPLETDAAPSANPLTWHFNPGLDPGKRGGMPSIGLGESSAPEVEERILSDVASYGRQLGRIEEALSVLLDHFSPVRDLLPAERMALSELRELLKDIGEKKACSFARTA